MSDTLSSKITAWQEGEECEKHNIAFCATCKEQANIRRDQEGSLRFDNDCAVRAFAAITEVEYEEAADLLFAAGYRPQLGTWAKDSLKAYQSAGFQTKPYVGNLEQARQASEQGRRFFVSSYKSRSGHAWAIVDGKYVDAWRPPFRYSIYEVIV